MARLAKGKIVAAKFDFRYLRFEGGRYGQAALEELKRSAGPDAALLLREATAAQALSLKQRWQPPVRSTAPVSVAANMIVWPAGAQMPASFVAQKWDAMPDDRKPDCLTSKDGKCDAFILDAGGDGKQQVLLVARSYASLGRLFAAGADGNWTVVATMSYRDTACKAVIEKLRKGEFNLIDRPYKDLNVGGRRVEFEISDTPEEDCSKIK
jgi:hypothetical protein